MTENIFKPFEGKPELAPQGADRADYAYDANERDRRKVSNASESAGIESYLASPLDFRKQYEKESGKKLKTDYIRRTNSLEWWTQLDYAEWLEKKLAEAYAAR